MADAFAGRGTGISHFQVGNAADLEARLGEVDVLIELVVEEMKERKMEDSAIDIMRENLEELSINRNDFMSAVADYIGDEYALYTSTAEYMRAEQLWAEYKANDVVMA
jgi:hypothetical protein